MTLEDLRILVAACEAGSLTSLAGELQRTQSSISQHISRLEAELGVRLLERHPRGVVPTPAGRILKEFALQGLDAIEFGLRRIRALENGEADTLTITTGGTTVRHFMRGAVVRFRKAFPSVSLRFLPANTSKRCFEILRLSQADLAFVTTGDPARGICERAVARQGMFLLVAKTDPLAKSKSFRLRDLRNIRYLGLAGGTSHHDAIEQAALAQDIQLRPEVVLDDFDTAKIFVELGLGQAIVPAMHAYNFTKAGGVKAVPILDLPPVAIGWAARNWHHLSGLASGFMTFVAQDLERLRDNIPAFEILEEPRCPTGSAPP